MTSEHAETQSEPTVSRVEAETTQPEGTIVQAEVTPPEHEPLRPEPAVVAELSAPELSSRPVVEEALPAEENDAVLTVPLADAPVSEELKSASAPTAEPMPVPVETVLVQAPVPMAAAAMEEPLKEGPAPQVAQPEPEPVVEAKAAQAPPSDEGSPNTELTRMLEEAPVPVAEPVLVSETHTGSSPEGTAEDSPSGLASPPAPEEDISTLPVPDQADSAATQTVPEALVPSAGPEAENEAFVDQPAEEGLPSQAMPKGQDPVEAVVNEQPSVEGATPIPDASVSESFPAADPATSTEDETGAAAPESAVAEGIAFGTRVPI
jgi:hypothetical protein